MQEIVDTDFDGKVGLAAAAISALGKERFGETRLYPEITRAIMYNLLADKSQIKFGHLEMVAHYLGVPVGTLLLYTRVKAAKRDNDQPDQEYVKSVLTVFLQSIEGEKFGLDELREIGTGNVQLSLF